MTILNVGGENFLRLGSNLILTRILFPEAFGLMALVQVVLAGAAMFSDFGFRGAVIQDAQGDDEAFLNTTWTLQIFRGVLLTAVILLLADQAADFYDAPILAGLLSIAAFVPLIKSFESTRVLTASRHLVLGRVTLIYLGSQLAGILVMIALAWWLQSVWALVIGNLVSPSLSAILSHTVLAGQKNRFFLDKSAVRRLLRYGAFIFLASAASFLAKHGDRAVLGKYVELADLAIYSIAALLASAPRRISNVISERVIFPLYARRPPAESSKNRHKLNKARRLLTGPLLVMAGVFALFGDLLVRILYDPRYETAGPYLVIIAVAIMPQVIVQSYYRLPLASGHSGRYSAFQILNAFVRFGLLLLLVPEFGLVGAIISLPVTTIVLYPVLLWLIKPYKSWDLIHDIISFGLFILLAISIFWVQRDVIGPVLDHVYGNWSLIFNY